MTLYEKLSILIALIATAISLISLYRTRKTSEIQNKLNQISTDLAEKQLDKIVESEEREGQPIFAVRTIDIHGIDNKVKARIQIDNTGDSYLEPRHVLLVALNKGSWRLCPSASLEDVDIREHDPILGERTLIIQSGAKLYECVLLITYIGLPGRPAGAEDEIFSEGASGELPFKINFGYRKSYRIRPYNIWNG